MLKYYKLEEKRHKKLNRSFCTPEEVQEVVKKIARHFRIKVSNITFVTGWKRWNYAFQYSLTFNTIQLSWLTVAHEMAHLWQDQLYLWDNGHWPPKGYRYHNGLHAEITSQICTFIQNASKVLTTAQSE